MLDRTAALLGVENLQAWYGESHVLHGVTFDVRVNSSDRARFLKGPKLH